MDRPWPIVGPTGAGTTTLVNLVLRFYDVDSGRITLDGVDLSEPRRAHLRGQIGMVLQDAWLFEGTLRDDIAYGRPDATPDQVQAAARATFVDRFVHARQSATTPSSTRTAAPSAPASGS